jgi:hypothetical protein
VDALQAIISSLYTNFLLRDFVGKVVPGGVVLFSMAILFAPPRKIFRFVVKLPVVGGIFLISVSWTLMLGLQEVVEVADWNNLLLQRDESTYIWNKTEDGKSYTTCSAFPLQCVYSENGKQVGPAICTDAQCVYVENRMLFGRRACPDDKLEHERFEVIKEACRNLLIAVIISIIPIARYLRPKYVSVFQRALPFASPQELWDLVQQRAVIFCVFAAISVCGLIRVTRTEAKHENYVLHVVSTTQPCPKASPTEGSVRE